MEWLEFTPWSQDVQTFCRDWLDQAARHPRIPSPEHRDHRELLREYGETCESLLEVGFTAPSDSKLLTN